MRVLLCTTLYYIEVGVVHSQYTHYNSSISFFFFLTNKRVNGERSFDFFFECFMKKFNLFVNILIFFNNKKKGKRKESGKKPYIDSPFLGCAG
jgi:hypothetical protein